ncbi:DUF6119 family protein [Enterococcus diestrammenae]|uniref:DUF6119 family protein n=1 Tax=Enterococcus diestrammenae TaxID=1155073 RepID=UPI00195E3943|nr:DUF6119 family protein [Enterococcus diestrammenae]
MKVKVYKANKTLEEITNHLEQKEYRQKGETKNFPSHSIKLLLYTDVHARPLPEWYEEMLEMFDIQDFLDFEPKQVNAVIVIETTRSIFLVPKGQGFWTVEGVCELDFGLRFGEKTVYQRDISLKGVSFVQRNKVRGVTHYKEGQNEFPQASEAFFNIQGKPVDEHIFGASINCGTAVDFSKNFNTNFKIETSPRQFEFIQLFNEIDNALVLQSKSNFPRIEYIKSTNSLSQTLDEILLTELKADSDQTAIFLNMHKIHSIANRVEVLSGEEVVKAYVVNHKSQTECVIDSVNNSLTDFIIEHQDFIDNINDVRIQIINEDGTQSSKISTIKEVAYCEIAHEGFTYILDRGRWGKFNQRFRDLLDEKLDEITQIVNFSNEYSIEYPVNDTLSGEAAYIEKLCSNKNYDKLHTRNINVSGTKVEIADVYSRISKELLAIKRGTKTALALYSFDQSILSIQALANSNDFNVEDELLKYNKRDSYPDVQKYPNIRKNRVKEIIECKKTGILWLIDKDPAYVYHAVISETFSLKDFKSLLLKVKIIDWYSFVMDNGFKPHIYLVADSPITEE